VDNLLLIVVKYIDQEGPLQIGLATAAQMYLKLFEIHLKLF